MNWFAKSLKSLCLATVLVLSHCTSPILSCQEREDFASELSEKVQRLYLTDASREIDSNIDSANSSSTTKSWTSDVIGTSDKPFLESLDWQEQPIGPFTLRTGIIYGKWVAAMQFVRDGQVVLTEFTPPYEYITIVDPLTARPSPSAWALDADNDGKLEIAFLHEKLQDPKYHMYTVYKLNEKMPVLIWKSGGELGDWLEGTTKTERSPRYLTGYVNAFLTEQ